MPSESAHILLAVRNQAAIDFLLQDVPRFSEWVTTVAFYKAVHIVEAVFAKQNRHGCDHGFRAQLLKQKQYENIWKHYRVLLAASTVARYLQDTATGREYTSFGDYLSPEQVRQEILDHYLHQVQKSAAPHLSHESRQALKIGALS